MLRRLRRGAVQRRGRRGPGPPLRFMITPLGPAVRENLVWDSVYFVFCSMLLLGSADGVSASLRLEARGRGMGQIF